MAEERVERRLAAILAADVAGYSRLIGADEEGTLNHLRSIRAELIDPKITEHRGRIGRHSERATEVGAHPAADRWHALIGSRLLIIVWISFRDSEEHDMANSFGAMAFAAALSAAMMLATSDGAYAGKTSGAKQSPSQIVVNKQGLSQYLMKRRIVPNKQGPSQYPMK